MPLTVLPSPGVAPTSPLGRTLVTMAFFGLGIGSVCASEDWFDHRGMTVEREAVHERLDRADIILLGEVHDSADIHDKQVELLEELGDAPLVLALEQLDLDHRARLEAMDRRDDLGGRELARRGRFDEDGWGWKHYGELFSLAAERGWPLRPINLSREDAREFARDGDAWRLVLAEREVRLIETLAPTLSLPGPLQEDLVSDLVEAHCGDLDKAFARRIARAQVARDILMAEAILAARDAFPARQVVAVMGNQHARLDRGAGYWIGRMLDERQGAEKPVVMAIGMLPVGEKGIRDIAGETSAEFDLRLVTEPLDRPPHCNRDGESSSTRGMDPDSD